MLCCRLRRAACHQGLVSNSQLARDATAENDTQDQPVQSETYSNAVLESLKAEDLDDDSCVICFEPIENKVLIKGCSHTG